MSDVAVVRDFICALHSVEFLINVTENRVSLLGTDDHLAATFLPFVLPILS